MQEIVPPIESLISKTIEEWKARSVPDGQYAVCLGLADGKLSVVARFKEEGPAWQLVLLIHPDHNPQVWRRV